MAHGRSARTVEQPPRRENPAPGTAQARTRSGQRWPPQAENRPDTGTGAGGNRTATTYQQIRRGVQKRRTKSPVFRVGHPEGLAAGTAGKPVALPVAGGTVAP